ncbi:MAG TPA: DEAD/DEAH box helicase [Stellaceae bacterium]|nr:DEAD/DEAH box helicase [Stellaceae bacterium]
MQDLAFNSVAFDEGDIRRCLPGSFEKGRSYHREGAVRDLRADKGGQRLIASVRGTRPRPYHVFVEIDDSDPIVISGRCSCPVGWNCKHAAAVLLEALRHPPSVERAEEDVLDGAVGGWLHQLRQAVQPPASPETVAYRLDRPMAPGSSVVIDLRVVRILKSGEWGADRALPAQQLQNPTANYLTPADRGIIRLLSGGSWTPQLRLPEDPEIADLAMRRILATGRCRWQNVASPPLALGPDRRGRLSWQIGADGRQTVGIALDDPSAVVLPSASPWYVIPAERLAGPVELDLARPLVRIALSAPPVTKAQAEAVGAALERELPGLALPRPRCDIVEEIRNDPPVPVLTLVQRKRGWNYWGVRTREWDDNVDLALLGFSYGGVVVDPEDQRNELRAFEEGRIFVRRRNRSAERGALKRLRELGLQAVETFETQDRDGDRIAFGFAEGQRDWPNFVYDAVPQLEREGWRIEFEDGFRHRVVDGAGDWTAELQEDSGWWFSLDLGIVIEGERVALLPVLSSLLARLRDRDVPNELDALAHNGTVFGRLEDGRHVALPLDRTKAIMATLVELYDPKNLSDAGKLGVSAGEMTGLAALEAATRLRWLGGERLRELAERLSSFSGIAGVEPPAGLLTELRPYQREGLNWLQFLRGYELGGILADDMGLGKTVQALAHFLVEKREGRLDRPCLVVCPTSVVPNWLAEAARLAPELRVLSLHGPDRADRFPDIDNADLVVTTYALLSRDADRLLPVQWHMAVLDEAQAIKNAAAKTTQLVCRLDARHRLCLTGTPMENHLGELWSQFAFLMPGLLGDAKRFTRVFRTPIEKKQDGERRGVLSGRLKPFLLRRTKSLVAADLPPKTEILRPLELAGPQRDLYETVRVAMHEKVRREVAEKGLARSHIVVLDALLKLRQVCCDPRLVKLTAARQVSASAKLEHLMEMLPPLIEDGRQILLFSQFTSMLDLIKPALGEAAIDYVELRGDTKDRAAPVAQFQKGKAPLFLISLKAGGTGLNLTAADTVIHYDPWWNPAVEDQATDRAHRIGQDKPVFVYKLVAQGTVEERMLELQQRKKALAAGIYDAAGGTGAGLEAGDIERLFEPLG